MNTINCPESFFNSSFDYFLKVKGLSMKNAGIMEDDLIAVKKTSDIKNGELKLTIKAEIDENWRLYSPKVYDDGPLATEIIFFSDTLNVRKKGFLLSSKPLDEFDPYFFKNISFFKNEAEFYQTLYYRKSSGEAIKGEISYQVCDDRLCIFRTIPFSLSIEGQILESDLKELKEYDVIKIDEMTLDLSNKDLLLSLIHI